MLFCELQVKVSRWALIGVVEARQKAPGQKTVCVALPLGHREENFRLLTFVDIAAFICTYLLNSHYIPHLTQLMRISMIVAATLTAFTSVWVIAAPSPQAMRLAKGNVSFKTALSLISATTTENETRLWGARYYFTLSLPENAGEALGKVTINQRQGFEDIRFKIEDTQAFRGTPGHKGEALTLKEVKKDSSSPAIAVTFDPPVQPGTTVTIQLRPVRNPSVSGIYIFGVTAFPAVENPYGLYLGVGRLHFYDSRPDFIR